jgi:hypothetical protein
MLVYRWEVITGEGCFMAGITSWFSNKSQYLYRKWMSTVHDKLPYPHYVSWRTPQGRDVPSVNRYFDKVCQYTADYTYRYAFSSMEQLREYMPKNWDKYLLEFGCHLVSYWVDADEEDGGLLVSDSQVVFLEDYAEFIEEII